VTSLTLINDIQLPSDLIANLLSLQPPRQSSQTGVQQLDMNKIGVKALNLMNFPTNPMFSKSLSNGMFHRQYRNHNGCQ